MVSHLRQSYFWVERSQLERRENENICNIQYWRQRYSGLYADDTHLYWQEKNIVIVRCKVMKFIVFSL